MTEVFYVSILSAGLFEKNTSVIVKVLFYITGTREFISYQVIHQEMTVIMVLEPNIMDLWYYDF